MLKYETPIEGKSVTIVFFDAFRDPVLLEKARWTCAQYDLNFVTAEDISSALEKTQNSLSKITHTILRTQTPFDLEILNACRRCSNGNYISFSLAFSYQDEKEALRYKNVINWEKRFLEGLGCLNIMRPDIQMENFFTVSSLKLVDNIICDTIRVKYVPVCEDASSQKENLPAEVKAYFGRCAALYGDHAMFHRSNTDGYFAIKHDQLIYITATKTPKDRSLDFNRIACIRSYDKERNMVFYSGGFLPSSDAVEACIVFEQKPEVRSIVHTHDSVRFTRNPRMAHLPRVPALPYGEAALGYAICEQISSLSDAPLVILEEHGEVFLGTEAEDASRIVERLVGTEPVRISI